MKATGIIRRIDDLGRIVIPKEIRRRFRVQEGDPLELLVDTDCIILRKYSELQVMQENVNSSIRSLQNHMGIYALVCDCDQVIATPAKLAQLKDRAISNELTQLIRNNQELMQSGEADPFYPLAKDNAHVAIAVIPLYRDGNAFGCIVVLGNKELDSATDFIMKSARMAAEIITDGIWE